MGACMLAADCIVKCTKQMALQVQARMAADGKVFKKMVVALKKFHKH